MTAREQHGRDRAGQVTASIASTIMSGGEGAWDTLLRNLWADDGSSFADAGVGGARGYGLLNECVGLALFWENHPGLGLVEVGFQRFARRGFRADHRYRRLLGYSPDALVKRDGKVIAGCEVKSPADPGVYTVYAAYCERDQIPPEHVDQVHFSLWASGLPEWYFVAHRNGAYAETSVKAACQIHRAWKKRFIPRLDAFLQLYATGQKPARNKLDSDGLAALLRRTV